MILFVFVCGEEVFIYFLFFARTYGRCFAYVKMQNLNIKVLSKVCEILRVPRCFLSILCYIKFKKLQPARKIKPISHEAHIYKHTCRVAWVIDYWLQTHGSWVLRKYEWKHINAQKCYFDFFAVSTQTGIFVFCGHKVLANGMPFSNLLIFLKGIFGNLFLQ